MPVISPRRSSSTTSGSLYIPQTTSGTYSSSLGNKTTGSSTLSSSSTSGYSSTYRSNGYSKTPSASTYSSYYTGSYLPRTSAYHSVGRSTYSSTSSSALTGGSSALSSYRPSSYLSGGNNDTTTASSRFGVSKYFTYRLGYRDTTPPTTTTTFTTRRRSYFPTSRLLNYSNYSATGANIMPINYLTRTSTLVHLPVLLNSIGNGYHYPNESNHNYVSDSPSNSESLCCSSDIPLLSSDHELIPTTSNCDHSTKNDLNYNNSSCNGEFISNSSNLNSPPSSSSSSCSPSSSKTTITTTTKPKTKSKPKPKSKSKSNSIENNINNNYNNNNNTSSTLPSSITTITTIVDHQQSQMNCLPQRDLDLKTGTENTDCDNNNNSNTRSPRSSSKSRNSRLSSSYSSSSLARLVATSALDIYEKYSPAHYIPKCELSRSSSISEAGASASAASASASATATAATSSKLNDTSPSNNSISRTNSYTKRYSRQTNGTIHEKNEDTPSASITDNYLYVPHSSSNNNLNGGHSGSSSSKLLLHLNYDLQDDSNSLRDLKISCISPSSTTTSVATTTTSSATTTSLPSSQDTKDTAQLAIKVRNSSSLRSALPPISPTPSRHWDRDSSRSSLLSSRNLSDDYSSSSKLSTTLDDKPEQEGLCGLRNIGNTCFMNSVIQCLSHTSELTKFLKTQNGFRSSSSKDQQILSEFAKLIREMWTSNVNSVTPSDLKRAFSSKHRMYSDYNQQDAQEFLRFFLDSLHSALNNGVKGDHLKIDESLSDNKKAEITWDWYTKTENSVIRDLFVGQLKSTLRCTVCGNTSVTFDPFWDLSVPLPPSSRCKLEACLDLFIREEILDGDEMPTCSKCQTRRKSTKSFTIQKFPKYLVIHLKRFSETRWSKLSNIVEFPTGERELNMGPYGSNSSSNAYYSLYAISNHMGSTAGGHYVALCKHPIAKKWHEFNDNIVSGELSESHLVSSSAYILFFERAN